MSDGAQKSGHAMAELQRPGARQERRLLWLPFDEPSRLGLHRLEEPGTTKGLPWYAHLGVYDAQPTSHSFKVAISRLWIHPSNWILHKTAY